ncbi:hypothetical protein EPI10_024575 [Gossypium australe]|uniref:Uncharacterized protein n=1 Tax=Gossypium australe TaxID=47621 RepID=A0A5B6VZ59_9ROSI|nr:hypothetical protein EPI10_024575 [Gossypium australe]
MSADLEKYLGMPIVVRRHKRRVFWHIKEKIQGQVDGWCTCCMLQGGRKDLSKLFLDIDGRNFTLNGVFIGVLGRFYAILRKWGFGFP